jgi:hypothetical protein
MFSTGKAAAYLGVGVKTLQRWDREGRLKPDAHINRSSDLFLGRYWMPLCAARRAPWGVGGLPIAVCQSPHKDRI